MFAQSVLSFNDWRTTQQTLELFQIQFIVSLSKKHILIRDMLSLWKMCRRILANVSLHICIAVVILVKWTGYMFYRILWFVRWLNHLWSGNWNCLLLGSVEHMTLNLISPVWNIWLEVLLCVIVLQSSFCWCSWNTNLFIIDNLRSSMRWLLRDIYYWGIYIIEEHILEKRRETYICFIYILCVDICNVYYHGGLFTYSVHLCAS